MPDKVVELTWSDLHARGMLWLINRCVFHPRGFALGVDPAKPGEFVLLGDGSEPWHFDIDDDEGEDKPFRDVEALFAEARGTEE